MSIKEDIQFGPVSDARLEEVDDRPSELRPGRHDEKIDYIPFQKREGCPEGSEKKHYRGTRLKTFNLEGA